MHDPGTDRLAEQLGAFHEAVAAAHQQAMTKVLEQAIRTLGWLTWVAHETAENAWQQKLAALQDVLRGLPSAAEALSEKALASSTLAEQARRYWESQNFTNAVRDLLARQPADIQDLEALQQALRWFFEALAQATGDTPTSGRASG